MGSQKVVVLALLLVVFALPVAATTVLVDPSSQSAGIGDTVTVSVNIQDVSNFLGFQFDLSYNPAVLAYVSSEMGLLMEDIGGSFCTDPKLSSGLVKAVACTSLSSTASGSGQLYSITFSVIGGGTSPLTLQNIKLSDFDANLIPSTPAHGEVVVGSSAPTCGDGVIQAPEECEPNQPQNCASNTCNGPGTTNPCTCVVTTNTCGDGIIQPPEECEPNGPNNCPSGTCNGPGTPNPCTCIVTGNTCGDNRWLPPEECDGPDIGGHDCVSKGFARGTLKCSNDCTHDVSGCDMDPGCDNDCIAESGEECDQSDLRGKYYCSDIGSFTGGMLSCKNDCKYDTSMCSTLTGGSSSITVPDENANQGDIVTLNIEVSEAADVFAFQTELRYDPRILEFIMTEEGDFLSQSGSTFCGEPSSNDGIVTVACTLLGAGKKASGSGSLFTASFKALKPGASPVTLENLVVVDSRGNQISMPLDDGSVTVSDDDDNDDISVLGSFKEWVIGVFSSPPNDCGKADKDDDGKITIQELREAYKKWRNDDLKDSHMKQAKEGFLNQQC